jgi:ribosomal protein L7/L12
LQHPDELRQLLKQGEKIRAIKLYRIETGVGLKDAKQAVEYIEANMRREQESASSAPGKDQPLHMYSGLVDPEKLQSLIRQGRKIEAIKYFRQQSGAGLREAKDAVDWLEASMRAKQ